MPSRKIQTRRKAKPSEQQAQRLSRHRNANAERILWKYLRDGRLGGYQFERRCRIEGHVFPFFCRTANLAIAIDRETHGGYSRRDYKFDTFLLARGTMVGHFGEAEIRSAPKQVANQILATCHDRTHPRPSVALNPSYRAKPPVPTVRIAPRDFGRGIRLASIAFAIALIGLLVFQFSRTFQGSDLAQKPLATLTPAPTRTLPGPTPTLAEIVLPTPSAERQAVLASNAIFAEAEKNLDTQPQAVLDRLLPQLSQFTAKSDLADAYSYLGRAELKLKHYGAAAGYFKQLYSLEPSVEYLYSLAVAYDLAGDRQNALASYRALADWNGSDAAAYRAAAERRIKELEQKPGTPTP